MAETETGPGRSSRFSRVARWLGPAVALFLVAFVELDPARPAVTRAAAVAVWMAVWWIGEAVPLSVTALLPAVLFPALAVLDGRETARLYFNHVLLLFIGGFLVAQAMQRWQLHRRMALATLGFFGTRPGGLLAGFLAASGFLSMWISNTAATMMMVPIAIAVVLELERAVGAEAARRPAIALLLAVPYGANVGGVATLVGSPTNLTLVRVMEITFPDAPEITFARWMTYGLPVSVAFCVLAWLVLSLLFLRGSPPALDPAILRAKRAELGRMSFEEKVVLVDFVLLALLWVTRADLELGVLRLPGWSGLFAEPDWITDGAVAIALSVALFLVPARSEPGSTLLDGRALKALPWEILILFGGGFALAAGFQESGLSEWVGGQLSAAGSLHPLVLILIIALLVTFLTEMTSNMTTAEMLLPLLAGLALGARIHPLLLMLPATLSCSLAFMLPVATPPNAIAFGSGRLRIADMARAGLALNLLGALLVTLATWFIGCAAFDIDPSGFPAWAEK